MILICCKLINNSTSLGLKYDTYVAKLLPISKSVQCSEMTGNLKFKVACVIKFLYAMKIGSIKFSASTYIQDMPRCTLKLDNGQYSAHDMTSHIFNKFKLF